jgi:murein DD-endopeptidase MepM/ murein hydrolase activator NlpD
MAGQSGGGYGIALILSHGYGYQTLYAHLSKVLVGAGAHVVRGQIIAKSGRTGLVSGPHLHYEVRFNGICKNPADYFLDDLKASEYRAQLAAH